MSGFGERADGRPEELDLLGWRIREPGWRSLFKQGARC
jgi:hypothetical protein